MSSSDLRGKHGETTSYFVKRNKMLVSFIVEIGSAGILVCVSSVFIVRLFSTGIPKEKASYQPNRAVNHQHYCEFIVKRRAVDYYHT